MNTIRVAAAVIVDVRGRLLLVRKAGTQCFMQAGGKIEELIWLDPADAWTLPVAPLTRDHVLPLIAGK